MSIMELKSPRTTAIETHRPRRRSNAERSAATRARLIEAAVDCLYRLGYMATTTVLVAKKAKVSRGAMLHQFPTKVDLMLAVVVHAVTVHDQFHRRELMKCKRGIERFMALTDVAWEVAKQPSSIALTEIMMATRSDPELRRRFPPIAKELERLRRSGVWEIAEDIGITDRVAIDTMVQLHMAALHGLSLSLMFTPDKRAGKPAVELLKWYKTQLVNTLAPEIRNGNGRAAGGS